MTAPIIDLTAHLEGISAEDLAKLPDSLQANLQDDLDRAGDEVAREMKLEAPKAFSNLVNSIRAERDSVLSRWVGSGLNYAIDVERGTGPAAGRAPYFPNVANLEPWVKLRSGISLRNTRQGTPQRQGQLDDLRDRAWAAARAIAMRGTRAQPFVGPTAEKMAPRVAAILGGSVDRTLAELPK